MRRGDITCTEATHEGWQLELLPVLGSSQGSGMWGGAACGHGWSSQREFPNVETGAFQNREDLIWADNEDLSLG